MFVSQTTVESEGRTFSISFEKAIVRHLSSNDDGDIEVFLKMHVEDDLHIGRQLRLRINGQSLLFRAPRGGRPVNRSCFEFRYRVSSAGLVRTIAPVWVEDDSEQPLGSLDFQEFDRSSIGEQRFTFDPESDDGSGPSIGLAPGMHFALMIVCLFVTFIGCGVIGHVIRPGVGLIVGAASGTSVVFLAFQFVIPVKCPDCGRRVRCRIRGGSSSVGSTPGSSNIRYECRHCGFRFPE